MSNQIYTCLWSDGQALDMANHYCSIFKNSKFTQQNNVIVNFELNNTRFMALNGGPKYKFSPATSFVIECETQDEIDHYWQHLGEGGAYNMCGWLDDKFGVSWQVVPKILGELLSDPIKAPRVTKAFLDMQKFDIQTLLDACSSQS